MSNAQPVSFDKVYSDEVKHLRSKSRKQLPTDDPKLQGLALSGGGIRSATFNLGLLQSLVKNGVFRRFDYLSTVSGGAYIGAWLVAMTHRMAMQRSLTGKAAHSQVKKKLLDRDSQHPVAGEAREIHHLREYSSYLTPRRGLLSADTWTFVGGFLAHFILNLLVVVTALAALLVLFQLHIRYLQPEGREPGPYDWPIWVAGAALLFALTFEWINAEYLIARMAEFRAGVRKSQRKRRPRWASQIHLPVILPKLASAWFMCMWLSTIPKAGFAYGTWTTRIAVSYAILAITSWAIATLVRVFCFRADHGDGGGARLTAAWSALSDVGPGIVAFVATALAAGAFAAIMLFVVEALSRSVYHYWRLPLVIAVYVGADLAHVGLTGAGLSAEAQEWRLRLGTSLLRFAVGVAFLGLVLFVGQLAAVDTRFLLVAAGAWLGLVGIAYIAGKLAAGVGGWVRLAKGLAGCASVMLVVGVVAALAGLAEGFAGLLASLIDRGTGGKNFYMLTSLGLVGAGGTLWLLMSVSQRTWWAVLLGPAVLVPAVCYVWGVMGDTVVHELDVRRVALLLTVALTAVLAWRIDVNEFSAHGLYRNRLGRCYLGASNSDRRANPFTDFDVEDDQIELKDLAKSSVHRPYPIFNTALNLVRGDQLAWQDRMATSFVLTPLYCGYQPEGRTGAGGRRTNGYQSTKRCGDQLTLGTAMAISGAAVSPSMGLYSSGARAFLLAVLNFRLGRWMGNPAIIGAWEATGPRFGLGCLGRELLGLTSDRGKWVYLSDGGHFENLGVYELLRRECSCIVVSDATADPQYRFESLFNLIRRARTDFGVEIDVGDLSGMRPTQGSRDCATHCRKMRVAYANGRVGQLVYVKVSFTGDEPADLREAERTQRAFPHQSTTDQFFSEKQFESYRQLGFHIGADVAGLLEQA